MTQESIIVEGQRDIVNRVRNGVQSRVLRIDDWRGILHWCGDNIENIEQEKIVLCFNGGNHFTAVRVGTDWVFYKGWFDKDPSGQEWRETQFKRADLLQLIKLSTHKLPAVQYVPKNFCNPKIRIVMFNYHKLGIRMQKDEKTFGWNFKLLYLEGTDKEQATAWLGGKPWESIPARDWCRGLPNKPALPFKKFALDSIQDAIEEDRENLEAREDWGLF